jgi:hypothetical protein
VASWSKQPGDSVLVKTERSCHCARRRRGAYTELVGGEGAVGQGRRKEDEQEVIPMQNLTRQTFANMSGTVAAGALAFILTFAGPGPSVARAEDQKGAASPSTESDKLQSEFLFDLTLEAQPPNNLVSSGSGRLIVPVSGGTFAGHDLKGTVVAPGGDWVVQRPDGSRVLDVRLVLQTEDGQKIYMSWRGIAYTPAGGKLFARILPMFETASPKYAWLNNVVAVGVYRPDLGKIAYRVYRIL